MTDQDVKPKFDRSPKYPFISLRKAEERAKTFWAKHRKEGARVSTVADTWGYGVKSSGLQQTVGALKQYGLLDDAGSGDDRKVQLTDLGIRLIADNRPGARESALKEAAMRPRLFQEYRRWIDDPPSEAHCLSELELDRGFNPLAARTFWKALMDTAAYAGLREDGGSSVDPDEELVDEERPAASVAAEQPPAPASSGEALPSRLKVEIGENVIMVSAVLRESADVEKLVRILNANKELLED